MALVPPPLAVATLSAPLLRLPSAAQPSEAARRTDIEALRVVVCAMVMLLHALLIFAPEPLYHLKSGTLSVVAGQLAELLRVCTMPLFFAIAGWSAVISLRRRGPRAFLRERVRRILVPLVAGMVLFCPLIKYIELRAGRDLRPGGFRLITPTLDSFPEFLPKFFGRLSYATWSHLWFLAYLLVISIVLLPALAMLARQAPRLHAPTAALVYAPAPLLGLALAALHGYWPYYPNLYGDPGTLFYYGACLIGGAVLAAWPGWEIRLRSECAGLLGLAALGFAGVCLFGESEAGRFCVGLTAWSCTAGLIGLASRHAPRRSDTLDYLSRATLPVYILHHAPLLAIALLTLRTGLDWPVQAPLIWAATIVATLAAYHWLIRPWQPTRWLLGAAK